MTGVEAWNAARRYFSIYLRFSSVQSFFSRLWYLKRLEIYKYFFNRDDKEVRWYDLCIKTGSYSLSDALDLQAQLDIFFLGIFDPSVLVA